MSLNKKNVIATIVSILGIVFISLYGCKKDMIQTNAVLKFSDDTVFLDTVITQLGTPTNMLKVYNPYNKTVRISSIKMAGGSGSEYIFNVNGMGMGEQTDVELKSQDSIYIFIQAKLKKNNVDTVVFHEDKLLFTIDNTVQDVKVVSWGRDAQFYKKQNIQTTIWSAGKSILIFDSLIVDAGQTLTIEEGASVLFKPKANLIINGTLIVKGSVEKPVIFEGYRLSQSYRQVPGQWGSIILGASSIGNVITNAIIRNGTNGFQFRKSAGRIDLTLQNVTINLMSYAGLLCYDAKVKAVNCVLTNCGTYILNLSEGGNYQFIHTTISNYTNTGAVRNNGSVYINNYKTEGTVKTPKNVEQALFQNSIIVGYSADEFKADKNADALFNVSFVNCLLKLAVKSEYMNAASLLMKDNNRLFIDSDKNFGLDSLSVARNIGDTAVGNHYPFDIKNRSRIADGKPDIGAYEYFKDTTKTKR